MGDKLTEYLSNFSITDYQEFVTIENRFKQISCNSVIDLVASPRVHFVRKAGTPLEL